MEDLFKTVAVEETSQALLQMQEQMGIYGQRVVWEGEGLNGWEITKKRHPRMGGVLPKPT